MDYAVDIPVANLETGYKVPPETLNYIPKNSSVYYQIVPLRVRDGVLEVGMIDPGNIEARDALQFIASKVGLPFKIFSITPADFDQLAKGYEGLSSEVTKALSDLDLEIQGEEPGGDKEKATITGAGDVKIVEDAPVTKIVAVILQHASAGNASDIHIEPAADRGRGRVRVDGVLYTSLFLPSSVHDAVVA